MSISGAYFCIYIYQRIAWRLGIEFDFDFCVTLLILYTVARISLNQHSSTSASTSTKRNHLIPVVVLISAQPCIADRIDNAMAPHAQMTVGIQWAAMRQPTPQPHKPTKRPNPRTLGLLAC